MSWIKCRGLNVILRVHPYEELPKRMSQRQDFSLCSLSDVAIRRAFFPGDVRIHVFKRRRISFTRIKNFVNPLSEGRVILSGVKKCWRAEKLMFLVRNDNLLLKNALLFGGFSTKCLLFLLCDISSRRRGFLGLQKMDFQNFWFWWKLRVSSWKRAYAHLLIRQPGG